MVEACSLSDRRLHLEAALLLAGRTKPAALHRKQRYPARDATASQTRFPTCSPSDTLPANGPSTSPDPREPCPCPDPDGNRSRRVAVLFEEQCVDQERQALGHAINRDQVNFQVLPRRWVFERFFSWVNRNRRLAKDFEGAIASAAFLYAAFVMLLTRHIARLVLDSSLTL